jgi:hypothetical protein
MADLVYNGVMLIWQGKSIYRATSGMPGHQTPSDQCLKDKGPVPEGNYSLTVSIGGAAKDDGTGRCKLEPSWKIQSIIRGTDAGECEPYWANWGENRIRFEPTDASTRTACNPVRSGFYLHDSTKGYSHGCIEVEGRFFNDLRNYAKARTSKKLTLQIKYLPLLETNGGTKVVAP